MPTNVHPSVQVVAAAPDVSSADIVEFIEARAATGDHVEAWAEDVATLALTHEVSPVQPILDLLEICH